MSGRWVIVHPEAEALHTKYAVALVSLKLKRLFFIQNEIRQVYIEKDSEFKSSKLKGDYYNIYCNKIDDWLIDARDILRRYNLFINNLNNCISAIDRKVEYYNTLRNERKWIEDAK